MIQSSTRLCLLGAFVLAGSTAGAQPVQQQPLEAFGFGVAQSVAAAPSEGLLAVATQNGLLATFDLETGQKLLAFAPAWGPSGYDHLRLSEDGAFLLARRQTSAEGTYVHSLFDTESGEQLWQTGGTEATQAAAAFTGSGQVVLARNGAQGGVDFRVVGTGALTATITADAPPGFLHWDEGTGRLLAATHAEAFRADNQTHSRRLPLGKIYLWDDSGTEIFSSTEPDYWAGWAELDDTNGAVWALHYDREEGGFAFHQIDLLTGELLNGDTGVTAEDLIYTRFLVESPSTFVGRVDEGVMFFTADRFFDKAEVRVYNPATGSKVRSSSSIDFLELAAAGGRLFGVEEFQAAAWEYDQQFNPIGALTSEALAGLPPLWTGRGGDFAVRPREERVVYQDLDAPILHDLRTNTRTVLPISFTEGSHRDYGFSSDGSLLNLFDVSSESDDLPVAADGLTGEEILRPDPFDLGIIIRTATFHPNGTSLFGAEFSGDALWVDGEDEGELQRYTVPGEGIQALAVSGDGSTLAGITDLGFLHKWDVTTGELLASFAVDERFFDAAQLQLDEAGTQVLVTQALEEGGEFSFLVVYDLETGLPGFSVEGLPLGGTAISAEGSRIAYVQAAESFIEETGRVEQYARGRVHEVSSGALLQEYRRFGFLTVDEFTGDRFSLSQDLEFSADGTELYVINDGQFQRWFVGDSEPAAPALTAQELTLGEAVTSTVSAFGGRDYRVDVPEGADLLVQLESNEPEGAFWLFQRFGAKVELANYDVLQRDASGNGAMELLLPGAQEGTHFLRVFGNDLAGTDAEFTITASLSSAHLSGNAPQEGGLIRSTSVNLAGMNFGEGVTLRLEAIGQAPIELGPGTVVSATEAFVSVPPIGIADVAYDLVADFGAAGTARLPEAFTFRDLPVTEVVRVNFMAPQFMRPGRTTSAVVAFWSEGNVDAKAPLLIIDTNLEAEIALPGRGWDSPPVMVLGRGNDAPANILSPGESGLIPMRIRTLGEGSYNWTVSALRATTDPVDWEQYKETFRPGHVSSNEWDIVWPDFQAQLGGSLAQFSDVLFERSERVDARGVFSQDARMLLGMIYREVTGQPIAAISGIAKDEQQNPLTYVQVIARSTDDPPFLARALTDENGRFSVDDLPDGDYTLALEGALLPSPEIYTIAGQQDLNGVVLDALALPEQGGGVVPEITARRSPALAVDGTGTPLLLWAQDDGLHASTFDGAWAAPHEVTDEVAYSPSLAWQDDRFVVAWQRGMDVQKSLAWAAGGPAGWSLPDALTSDGVHDEALALAPGPNGEAIAIWQSSDTVASDDTDLYWAPIAAGGTTAVKRNRPADELPAGDPLPSLHQSSCLDVQLAKGLVLPRFLPIIGGKYGFNVNGQVCGANGCEATRSGGVGMEVEFGKKLKGGGSLSAEAKWKAEGDADNCAYVFSGASGTGTVNASAAIGEQIQFSAFGYTGLLLQATFTISGALSGTTTWDSNFPGYPSGGQITITVGGAPNATVESPIGSGGAEGSLSVKWEYIPPATLRFSDYCIGFQGGITGFWGFEFNFSKNWGVCLSEVKNIQELREGQRFVGRFREGGRLVTRMQTLQQGVPVDETFEISVNSSFSGNSSVHTDGSPVLPGVDSDLFMDGEPALARSSTGEMLLAWCKEPGPYDVNYGSQPVVAFFTGSGWTPPMPVEDGLHFSKHTSAAYDGSDRAVVVWSRAEMAGLGAGDDVAALFDAMNNSDIAWSRLEGTDWTAATPIAELPGRDEQPVVIADGGALIAAWVNLRDGEEVEPGARARLYAARHDGTAWSDPVLLAEAAVLDPPALVLTADGPLLAWSQGDEDGLQANMRLLYAFWTGAEWTAPEELAPEAVPQPTRSFPRTSPRVASSIGTPPDDCCEEEDPDEPSEPSDEVTNTDTGSVGSFDPNEKRGPEGYGPGRQILISEPLLYTVYFENLTTATAAAQEVFIVDDLDTAFDWSTVTPVAFGFGDRVQFLTGEAADYEVIVPYTDISDGLNYQVRLRSTLNRRTGRLEWYFKTEDPVTGDFPENVFAGFLPPNDDTGRGDGFVSFLITPRADVEEATIARNKATIIFDVNEPIITNEESHTLVTEIILSEPGDFWHVR